MIQIENKEIEKRKSQHIAICLEEDVEGRNITTGLEKYRLVHQALPEINFSEINTETNFLSKQVKTPFLISSMTGGTQKALTINRNLAQAAEEQGWALALGSTRSALESRETAITFQMRKYAPSIPIIANLGAVQLNYGYGVEECRRILELTEADALVLHLNSLQEVIQNEGDTNFKGLIQKIEKLCNALDSPIGIKEVGFGINGQLARHLKESGISFIDVAGAGGTSWTQVEKYRSQDLLKTLAADAFQDWGIPTAECITDCRSNGYKETLIASGGIKTGVEAAKSIALGADMVGYGRSILEAAVSSKEQLVTVFKRMELELKISMFGVGAKTIEELKSAPIIPKS